MRSSRSAHSRRWLRFGIWSRSRNRQSILPPAPGDVFRTFVRIIVTGQAWPDLKLTLFEFSVAGPIAVFLGGGLGFLISLTRYSSRVFEPIISSVYAIPIIIFYPVSVMALGIGPESKIAHGALFGFFPMCLSTIQGFSRVDPLLIRLAHSSGATKWQLFWRIMLPAAAPTILSGVRLGLMLSFLAIIGAKPSLRSQALATASSGTRKACRPATCSLTSCL